MKKHISILLLASLLASLAACGTQADTEKETSDTPSETTLADEKLTDGLPDKNMDGFELKILHNPSGWMTWANIQLDSEAENGDLVNDAIYRRNVAVEDRFKCSITVDETENSTEVNYRNLVMSGDNPYDIIMVYGIGTMGLVDNYADIGNIPYLSLGEHWWNPDATSVFNVGGKQLCAAGAFSLSYASTANCLLFNKRIYSEMNTGESLYDLVDSGKWTTDKYFEIASNAVRDLNGDSKMDENDLWGVNGVPKSYMHMLVIGSGQHYVTKDTDGFPVFNAAKDEKLVDFLGKVVRNQSSNPYSYAMNDNVDYAMDGIDFRNSGCLFQISSAQEITYYRDMQDDFGIIPAPKYDEKQEKYYANMSNGEVMTLPRSYDADRLENIGMLLEAMSFYTYHDILPVYKTELLQTKVARDEDSSRMLDLIFNGVTYDFGVNVWQVNIGNRIVSDILIAKSDAIVSTLSTLSTSVEGNIEKLRESVEAVP